MAISLVQKAHATNNSNSLVVTLPGPTTAGNFLFALLASDNSATDTFTLPSGWVAAKTQGNGGVGCTIQVAYCANCAGGLTTLTFQRNTSAFSFAVHVAEYSGVATTSPLDQVVSTTGTGSPIAAGSLTTTQASELLILSTNIDGNTTLSAGASMTVEDTQAVGATSGWEDRLLSATGSYNAQFTTSSGNGWAAIQASFKAATGGGTTTTPQTQSAAARVQVTQTRTQPAHARIQVTRAQTQSATARVQITQTRPQSATARITALTSRTQSGAARLRVTQSHTLPATARIALGTTRTLPATARVTAPGFKTQTATARVTAPATHITLATARLTAHTLRTLSGGALIQVTGSAFRTLTATARLRVTRPQTQAAVARITVTTAHTQSGVARVTRTRLLTQAASGRITAPTRQTTHSAARVTGRLARTLGGTARIFVPGAQAFTPQARTVMAVGPSAATLFVPAPIATAQ